MSSKVEDSERWALAVHEATRTPTLLERIGQKLIRLLPASAARLLESDPETAIHDEIARFARSRSNVTFVQIGSCDGKEGDPLSEHVLSGEWSGVVVEPVPANFERLRHTYRNAPNVNSRNVAISDECGTKTFYVIDAAASAELPSWVAEIGSFDKSHLTKHAALSPGLEKYISSIDVQCIDFNTLVEETGFDRIDMIHTDVEGYDYHILKQIDFKRWKPRMVLFEDFHMTDVERVEAFALLSRNGYRFIEGSMNVLAISGSV